MAEKENMLRLPLLVCRALIVFPSMSEEIDVGRDFSMQAVRLSRKETNNLIFVVSQKDESLDTPTVNDVFSIGTLCRIVSASDNGNSIRIRVIGSRRVALSDITEERDTWYASGKHLESSSLSSEQESQLIRTLLDKVYASKSLGTSIPRGAIAQFRNGGRAEDLCDTLAVFLMLPLDKRQALLEETDVKARAEKLLGYIEESEAAVEIENTLASKVRENSEKQQKEYLLREKMKAIKEELGEGKDNDHSEDAILRKLEENP